MKQEVAETRANREDQIAREEAISEKQERQIQRLEVLAEIMPDSKRKSSRRISSEVGPIKDDMRDIASQVKKLRSGLEGKSKNEAQLIRKEIRALNAQKAKLAWQLTDQMRQI